MTKEKKWTKAEEGRFIKWYQRLQRARVRKDREKIREILREYYANGIWDPIYIRDEFTREEVAGEIYTAEHMIN